MLQEFRAKEEAAQTGDDPYTDMAKKIEAREKKGSKWKKKQMKKEFTEEEEDEKTLGEESEASEKPQPEEGKR